MSAGKPPVGFIGTGLMGLPMSRRLLQAGYELTVWNRTLSKAEPLVADGARLAESAAGVAAAADIDAVYVSCTSLKLAEAIEQIEEEVGLPVLSSNHVMAWHALRLGNVQQPIEGFGRIFRHSLSARPHAA